MSDRTRIHQPELCASDYEILQKHHEFIRDDQKDERNSANWETRMSRLYYDKLYKEFAICDLKGFKINNIGMRWRTETEVITGKGEHLCAATDCIRADGLRSFEVPFRYEEAGISKVELVKVRVCSLCARKLYYHTQEAMAETDENRKRKR